MFKSFFECAWKMSQGWAWGNTLTTAGIAVFQDHSNFVGIIKKTYFFFSHYGSTEYKLHYFVNKERRQRETWEKERGKKSE